MKKSLQLSSLIIAFLSTACVPNIPSSTLTPTNQQTITFKTNQVHFMHTLKETSTKEERNAYLDEFLLKSDMQCQNYLNNPLKKSEVDTSKDSLYMNLFDTVSTLFGISFATNAAKAVFLDNDTTSTEEKKAYANALSPEIRKGVEIARARYAKEMLKKKRLNLKEYSINDLREDILKYDKQCDDAYGLIEINRALKEMQSSVHTRSTPTSASLNIDPNAIKERVIEATQEVKAKKLEKEQHESNATQVSPTQPKLQNAPQHHDNELPMPHSIQL